MMSALLSPIDEFLNSFTMYSLLLNFLRLLLVIATVLSFLGVLPYNGWDILFSGLYLITLCWVINVIFAKTFQAKTNAESAYITGSILALIVGPVPLLSNIGFLTLLPVLAMASKYLLAYHKQHIFNPAAFSVVVTAVFLGQGASWWVGDRTLLPVILLGGLLIVRKMRRFHLILAFFITYALLLVILSLFSYGAVVTDIPSIILSALSSPSILFFAFVMLTEPITSPANPKLRVYFGIMTAVLFILIQNTLAVYYSLELSLICANLLGRILYFPKRYQLLLEEKKQIGENIWEFLFQPVPQFTYNAGQFLEWTLPHKKVDIRGNRRYFTIASSPTEKEIKLIVKIPEKTSSYKNALLALNKGDEVLATNLEGNFTLQGSPASYVFIAGGIGITPFLSMIRYMLDKNIRVPVTLFYITHKAQEVIETDLLTKAEKELGFQVIYLLTEGKNSGRYEQGRLTQEIVKKYVKDFQQRYFYLSGPQPMVTAYQKMLRQLSIPSSKIKTDYFPGYIETYTGK